MSLIKSPAGDMELRFERVDDEEGSPVVVSRLGVWDSRIYLEPEEMAWLARMLLRRRSGWRFLLRTLRCLFVPATALRSKPGPPNERSQP